MGEWEHGLEAARKQGIIDQSTHDRLSEMSFEREISGSKFPMRIALIVLGAILLVSAGFSHLCVCLAKTHLNYLLLLFSHSSH